MVNELFPLLDIVDAALAAFAPLLLRICLWGILAGAVAMALYAVASPQKAVMKLKLRAAGLRRRMLDPELDASAFRLAARENISVSLRLLGRVVGPALLSAVPVLIVASWIDATRGYDALSNPPSVRAPASVASRQGATGREIELVVDGRPIYSGRPLDPPTPVLHKRLWWNAILANPAGYLTDDAPVEEVALDVEKRVFANWLPDWAAGWETPFFLAVLVSTLGVKLGFRIT